MRVYGISVAVAVGFLSSCSAERCPPGTIEVNGLCVREETVATPVSDCRASGDLGGSCAPKTPVKPRPTRDAGPQASESADAADAATTAPKPAPVPEMFECQPAETRCSSEGTTVERCSNSHSWVEQERCASVCTAGACSGDCKPGTKRCGTDQTPETCDPTGHWIRGTRCDAACSVTGECLECAPGDRRCGGPRERSQEVCDANGNWMPGSECPNVCLDGKCTGSCPPQATMCEGQTPKTCDDRGEWQAKAPCRNSTCIDGSCSGVCEPGARQCSGNASQVCGATGNWSTATTCPGRCVAAGTCVDCLVDADCGPESQVCVASRCVEIQCSAIGGVAALLNDYCCDRGCAQCGGGGCSDDNSDLECCGTPILRGPSCKAMGPGRRAPCWLTR